MVDRLTAIMARLRDPERGCSWDLAQDLRSVAPYTIEEAYEVADAIDRGDMAEERGAFALADVVDAICDKMERRHPHIFGDSAATPGWEQIKADERAERSDDSAVAGVALGLPALLRAEKLQSRAARTGFDWPDVAGSRAKIDEELAEVAAAPIEELADEVGDVLFSVVNWARHLGVDAEAALRQANAKFETRFRTMKALGGTGFPELALADKENLWLSAKALERKAAAS